MKTFAIGDIHGRIEALKQVLEASRFDYEKDKLIVLGDVCDGGENTKEVIDELLKIKNLVYILGNHDEWFKKFMESGWSEEIWLQQGGANTLRSYGAKVKLAERVSNASEIDASELNIPITHENFINNGILYYIMDNMIFVHGGFNPRIRIDRNEKQMLLWDRQLIYTAMKKPVFKNDVSDIKSNVIWDKVFVGHTATQLLPSKNTLPKLYHNLWVLDTGAGWSGKLTLMDVNSEEYWQSDTQLPGDR